MIFTGRLGYASWAEAGPAAAASASAAAANVLKTMQSSFFWDGIIAEMKTIDIHAHWYPEEWIRLFEKDGAKDGASLERKDGKYHLKEKHISNVFDERFVVVDERVKEMNKRGVDVHALSLTTPMVYWASPGFGLALSQAFNDAASAAHKKHPARLLGLAMLPM